MAEDTTTTTEGEGAQAAQPSVDELMAQVKALTDERDKAVAESRKWEGRSKSNSEKAKKYDELAAQSMNDAERADAEKARAMPGVLAVLTAETFVPGIYHFSDEGACSWYDFTVAIHRLAGITCRVKPIRSDEYPSRAHRPFYSVLDKSKIKQTYGITIPHWYESLSHCIEILQETR